MNVTTKNRPTRRELVQALLPYAKPDTRKGLKVFLVDYAMLLVGLGLALFGTDLWVRALGAVLAGAKLNGLYTVGHDAGHNVLTASRKLNSVLAFFCYLPTLFNFRLWHYDHQIIHHVKTNGPQVDVYRPMSLEQYRASPLWRRAVERLFRALNPVGFAAYITYHSRFEQSKFFPHKDEHPEKVRKAAWPVTWWTLAYLGAFLGWLVARNWGEPQGLALDVLFAFAIPFFVFMNGIAIGVYLQHTHPNVPWFKADDPARAHFDQVDLTVNFKLPKWFDYLSHEVMAHQVHHLLPAIPSYNLRAAQNKLEELLGDACVTASPKDVASIFRRCKLYDFENRRWLDFDGNPTTDTVALPTSPQVVKEGVGHANS
jgi:acyl-lipid omega-6 desaturase (Delta-12 desaturase)